MHTFPKSGSYADERDGNDEKLFDTIDQDDDKNQIHASGQLSSIRDVSANNFNQQEITHEDKHQKDEINFLESKVNVVE
jgi:hypothetical protein